MSGKRILLYLLAAGLLGLLIYALVPKDSGRGPDNGKAAQGDDGIDAGGLDGSRHLAGDRFPGR